MTSRHDDVKDIINHFSPDDADATVAARTVYDVSSWNTYDVTRIGEVRENCIIFEYQQPPPFSCMCYEWCHNYDEQCLSAASVNTLCMYICHLASIMAEQIYSFDWVCILREWVILFRRPGDRVTKQENVLIQKLQALYIFTQLHSIRCRPHTKKPPCR